MARKGIVMPRLCFLMVCILLVGCTERQVRIHFERAEKYRHEGKIDLAIEEYKAILDLSPDAFDARKIGRAHV